MFPTICTLKIGDRQASATVATASPQAQAQVRYSGDLDLFSSQLSPLANADLRQVCKMVAKQAGAELSVAENGEYESWAE